jgi:serine/threonine protein phosphatase 1
MVGQKYKKAAERLHAVLSPKHFDFLSSLRLSLTFGDYFLCHAGVRPGVPLENQSEHDLLWIRAEFLNSHDGFWQDYRARPHTG